jgi:hypothetical protein
MRRSIELVRRDCPQAWVSVCQEMQGRLLSMEVDGEAFDLDVSAPEPAILERAVAFESPPPEGTILLIAGRVALLELVDGERSLLDAAFDESVRLRGATLDLAAFDVAMRAFLSGAVRSAACIDLLALYRAWANERTQGGRQREVIRVG